MQMLPAVFCLIVVAVGGLKHELQAKGQFNEIVPQLGISELSPRSIVFTSTEDVIAVLNADGRIDLLDISNIDRPVKLREIFAGASAISPLSGSTDEFLVSGGYDGSVRFWTREGLQLGESIEASDEGIVASVSSSPESDRIVVGTVGVAGEQAVHVWTREEDGWTEEVINDEDPPSWVTSVAFSPIEQSKQFVTGDNSGTVLLWNREKMGWTASKLSEKSSDGIASVAFSPNGKHVAAGGRDYGEVMLWTLKDEGWSMQTLGHHDSAVRSMAFSPDGERLVTGTKDSEVRLWKRQNETSWDGQDIGIHEKGVSGLAFSPQGDQIVSSGALNGTLKWWKHENARWLERTVPGSSRSYGRWLSPNGKQIAIAEWYNGSIRLLSRVGDGWVKETLGERTVHQYTGWKGPPKTVTSLAFNPKHAQIVSGDALGEIRLWTKKSGYWVEQIIGSHQGKYPESQVSTIAFSPHGNSFVSGGSDGEVRLWELKGNSWIPSMLGLHEGSVQSVVFSLQGDRIVSSGIDGAVRVWMRYDQTWFEQTLEQKDGGVSEMALSSNGNLIAALTKDGKMQLWTRDSDTWISHTPVPQANSASIVSLSVQNNQIATGGIDGAVQVWSRDNKYWNKQELGLHQAQVIEVGFSPKGDKIVSSGADGTVQLWTRDNDGWNRHNISNDQSNFPKARFWSKDNQIVFSYGSGVQLWTQYQERWTERVTRGLEDRPRMTSVAFSLKGNKIVHGDSDGSVFLWERTNSGWNKLSLGLHDKEVTDLALSANDDQIVSGSLDGMVRTWTLEDTVWVEQPLVGKFEFGVQSVGITPKGDQIVALGDSDNVPALWLWTRQGGSWNNNQKPYTLNYESSLAAELAVSSRRADIWLWALEGHGSSHMSLDLPRVFVSRVVDLPGGRTPSAAVSPQRDDRFIVGDQSGNAQLWSRDANAIDWTAQSLGYHGGGVTSTGFSPEGDWIATGGVDGVLIQSVKTGEIRHIDTCGVRDIQFLDSGSRLIVGCRDRWLIVDFISGVVVGTLFPTPEGIVAESPGIGVWFPSEESRRFMREVNGDLDLNRSLSVAIGADSFHRMNQTLFDEWTEGERLINKLIHFVDAARQQFLDLHWMFKTSALAILCWITLGVVAIGLWIISPWRLAQWSLPKTGAPELPPWKWMLSALAWYGWLGRTKRPVEKWLDHFRPEFELTCFVERAPVRERRRYAQLAGAPVEPNWFNNPSNRFLWIYGSGGGGKSALCFHLVRSAFLGKPHQPLPILIDEDWDGTLADHVARLLRPAKSNRVPTAKMVQRLGSLGKLCPIIDSLSERSASDAVSRVGDAIATGSFAYAMITSREQPPPGQVWDALNVIEARPISTEDIRPFVASYVDDVSARGKFEKRTRKLLGSTIEERAPSALFLRFALEQMIELQNAPSRNIDLVLRYIEVARAGKVDIAAEDFLRVACLCAFEALRNENTLLVPAEIIHERLVGALNAASDATPFRDESRDGVVSSSKAIEYLVSCGVLHRNQLKHRLQFTYDPVAEYLSAWQIDRAPEEYASQLKKRLDSNPNCGVARALQELKSMERHEPSTV